jgi:DNA-binding GntR family transcriptional regulator
LDEHKIILKHIINRKPDEASAAMKIHLQEVLDYSRSLKNGSSNGHI